MATPQTWNTSTHMDRKQFPYVEPYVKKRASQPAGVLLSHDRPPLPATMNRREAAKRKGPLRRIYSSHNVVVEEAKSPCVGILTRRLPLRLNASGPSKSARVLEACLQRRPAPTTSPSPLPSRSPSPPAPRTTRTATMATGCCLLRCSSLGVACLAGAGRSDATASHHPDESTVSPQRFAPALKHTYRFGVSVNLFTPTSFDFTLLALRSSTTTTRAARTAPPVRHRLYNVLHPHGNESSSHSPTHTFPSTHIHARSPLTYTYQGLSRSTSLGHYGTMI